MVTGGPVLTERDLAWLRWMGWWRAVTAAQVAAWWLPELSSGVKVVERRFRAFRELGLVERRRVLADLPSAHSLSLPGMRKVGVQGAVAAPIVGQMRHDLAVVDAATWIHRRRDVRFVTERHIRRLDPAKTKAPRYAIPAVPEAGRSLIYPDFITVDSSGQAFAHEVELSPKESRRLRGLMDSYAAASHIDRVAYYVKSDVLRARIEAVAAEANLAAAKAWGRPERFISVFGWNWEGQ